MFCENYHLEIMNGLYIIGPFSGMEPSGVAQHNDKFWSMSVAHCNLTIWVEIQYLEADSLRIPYHVANKYSF